MISRRVFERARTYVSRSGVPEDLEARLRANPGGRPRALAIDVLLSAMVLSYDRHQSLALTDVHRVLTKDLADNYQRELGLRSADGSALTVRQVRYAVTAITSTFDYTGTTAADLPDDVRAAREAAFQQMLDRLTSAASTHVAPTGRYAVDATAIESAARGRRRPKPSKAKSNAEAAEQQTVHRELAKGQDRLDLVRANCDPDARWGYRTRTYENKTNMMFGYQMLAFTRVGLAASATAGAGARHTIDDQPMLIERIAVVPGNSHGIEETIECLDRDWLDDTPVLELLADRAFSYGTPENWAYQLRDRGIAQVLDLHQNDHGAVPHVKHGYTMVDGWPHCPSMPEHLERVDRPKVLSLRPLPRTAGVEERAAWEADRRAIETFDAQIAERRIYRFERRAKSGSRSEQFICPAKAGKVKCAGCPLTRDFGDDVPEVTPPATLPKACKQATICVKPTVQPKLRQDLYWGSPEWKASYGRRNRVEGTFGLMKSVKGGNLRRGWTHQVGIVKTSFLLAVAVAASNLASLLRWAKRTGDTRDPLVLLDVTEFGFVELDEHGRPMTGTDPPTDPPN